MKNIKSGFLILVAAIITGFLIVNSINLNNTQTNISLNALEYKNAVEERSKLYNEIEKIKSENIDYRYKINKYKGNDPEKKEKLVQDMRNQLIDYGALSGITSVKGPGLVIEIKDGDIDSSLDADYEVWRKIFHENDLAMVLNELRNAGAEAITMNNHRILPNTGVKCYSSQIGFEDESMASAPFYIYAIGNPEEMKAYLLAENSFIQKLIIRKIKVEIEVKDEIILPVTKQSVEARYMQRYEEK
ncbi:DUF881 domain-containing protein [Clostridium sp.]|uniref:DUF881 domain-containing protein n=1 Tax=Clostridium sp. TaxID=1506 RepID=UPI0025BF4D51|nr:DUF881 domain-containing protein [Clostridium sp.]